ncbi:MAG: hypothetical protein C4K48_10080 [Candidatus Thorarchaeota archaeon]|nr:MAG: hypothetical protein C4K48_10080 [Candidatus Thorarchaeota archaeon]
MSAETMTGVAIVTGAAGFIGSGLVDLLLSRGYQVIGIDNFRTGTKENLAEATKSRQFQLIEADISDDSLINRVNERVDTVFHLAAVSSVKQSLEDPVYVNRVNVAGTLNVFEMARRLDARRIVFSSSAAVYGDPESMPVREEFPCSPLSPYAASKMAGEIYLQSYSTSYGIGGTILRYFNVFGPRQACSEYSGVISIFINQALENRPITIEGTGEQTRSFVYVDDVTLATLTAAERPDAEGMILNLSGTESISIADLAQSIKRNVKGTKSKIVHVSPRPGDIKDSVGSIKRAQKILDFNPETELLSGLRKTIEWYRARMPTL